MAGVLSQFFTSPDVELHRAAARQAEASHYGHTPHSAARGGGEEAGARPDHGLVAEVLQVCKGWSLVL